MIYKYTHITIISFRAWYLFWTIVARPWYHFQKSSTHSGVPISWFGNLCYNESHNSIASLAVFAVFVNMWVVVCYVPSDLVHLEDYKI